MVVCTGHREAYAVDAIADGLGALTLFVDDVPQAAAFYRDVLGLPAVWEDDNSTVFQLGATLLDEVGELARHVVPKSGKLGVSHAADDTVDP